MSVYENLQAIQKHLPEQVTLVAVSKTKPVSLIREAYASGIRDFGENKVQELSDKYQSLPQDIKWHMIGHLQRNKVKYIAPFIHLIQSVDSWKLLNEINKEAKKNERTISCLLQVHIARETHKYGFHRQELLSSLASGIENHYPHIQISGLMGMATFTDDPAQIEDEFRSLHDLFIHIKNQFFSYSPSFQFLSMGMSSDYPIALKAGSNMLRLGSCLFGKRETAPDSHAGLSEK